MKKLLVAALVGLSLFAAGWFAQLLINDHGMIAHEASPSSMSAEASDAEPPLYWVAPMDSNYRRDQPGKSPMGMDLVPVYEESVEGLVQIDPGFQASFGITTVTAESGRLALAVDTVGFVDYAEDDVSHVHSRVEGWIEKVYVYAIGDEVRKGQPLFELYSPEVVSAQNELIANVQRNNTALIAATERRLRLMGLDDETIADIKRGGEVVDSIAFLAPSDGVVTTLMAREGMYVEPSLELLSIADLSEVWVRAELFEQQQAWVEQGQPVNVRVAGMPRRQWEGEVDYIYPVVSNALRTAQLRVVLDNNDGALKPNMFTQLRIEAGVTKAGIIVPEEALIKGERSDRVVIKVGESSFRSVRVRAGLAADGDVIILRGLSEGDQVVTSGQFLIDSESNISAASNRINGQ
ncbi:efflux RND transporter periplasmic adaptor subunit [uncultured Umboniibacter sp.]|uniref:efflux RND transporter periplasmic adaptor subunit n=1 Tax=uncultured Umboniibacter sp. TaxID=1798917 RepID=UPI00261E8799|nr:efflux RND transporter periplasmic adaptor subunit [uncultured Umboniibacter sp.]